MRLRPDCAKILLKYLRFWSDLVEPKTGMSRGTAIIYLLLAGACPMIGLRAWRAPFDWPHSGRDLHMDEPRLSCPTDPAAEESDAGWKWSMRKAIVFLVIMSLVLWGLIAVAVVALV